MRMLNFGERAVPSNVRLWLLADLLMTVDLCLLYPRKRTFGASSKRETPLKRGLITARPTVGLIATACELGANSYSFR